MRYWRLFFVLFLLTFSITGCHRRRVRVAPPPQAQAPIIRTLPPLPSFAQQPVLPPEHIQHRRVTRKSAPDTTAPESHPSSAEGADSADQTSNSTTVVGTLSADDSATNPDQTAQTKNLIQYTEDLLKKVSPQQQEEHKDTVAQIGSFLAQARQALSTNDQVGAQTLANKAKILVDELLK